MKPPKVVYVGPADYDVVVQPKFDQLGETLSDQGEIVLRARENHSLVAGTLVHELLHAIVFESGLNKSMTLQFTTETEEELVNMIAPWIYAVFFLDNPLLTAYLSEQRKAQTA